MKKILIFLIGIVSIFSLASCNIQISDPNITIDQIEKEDVDIIQIQNSITETIKKVNDKCVGVVAIGEKFKSSGSGVIYKILDRKTQKPATDKTIDAICYVITNEHVIKPKEKTTNYRIYLGEERYYYADCLGSDSKNDLAVLTFNIPLGESTIQYNDFVDLNAEVMDIPAIGSYAIAIGCPLSLDNFNYPTFGLIGSVTLSAITHSAPINPGNSGGGLFNTSGRLIGINVSKTVTTEDNSIQIVGLGRAIPIWTVKKVIEEIESVSGDIERPNLGIKTIDINASLSPEHGKLLPGGVNQGIFVDSIDEEGNASRLIGQDKDKVKYEGLKPGDIVFTINGKNIDRTTELEYYINLMNNGSDIKLSIYRKLGSEWKIIEFKGKLRG